jgi:hypothetical protein
MLEEYVILATDILYLKLQFLLDMEGEERESHVFLPQADMWVITVKMSQDTAAKCREMSSLIQVYKKEG